jgi:predicted TIM-barrel fold metal-dependent hydrolase
MVSLHDVDTAVAEARYAVGTLGLRAVQVRPNRHGGRNLGDPAYEPLWGAIAELGVPLAVHEGTGARLPVTGADRFLGSVLLQHVTSHPLEMMCAVASLICGGVLERHPTLRVAFLEAGASWLPYWLWRLDEHVAWLGRGEAQELRHRPSEYFRRQCFASIDCDETPLAHAIAAMGDDCFVFASDYPHPDAKYPNAVATFMQLPGISSDSRRKILRANATHLYGL